MSPPLMGYFIVCRCGGGPPFPALRQYTRLGFGGKAEFRARADPSARGPESGAPRSRPGNFNPVIESGTDSKNGTGASREGG